MARRDHPHHHHHHHHPHHHHHNNHQGPRQQQQQRWGSLEELLLACAVSRHGTAAWDSVAMEVQSRTSALPSPLTSQHCIDKFNDLKRRFTPQDNDHDNNTDSIVDQLRTIRVEELRREVQRCDVSIVSLEMKVKKLEEERERNLKEDRTDLAGESKPSPETIAAKLTAGEDDDGSYNESNSTSQQKPETAPAKEQEDSREVKPEPDPVQDDDASGLKTERDWSRNGKFEGDGNDDKAERKETVVNNNNNKSKSKKTKPSRTSGVGESVDLKEKEKDKEQNSDVQSSASLSVKNSSKECKNTKKRRRGGVGSSSGDEDEDEDEEEEEEEEEVEVSPATKKKRVVDAVKSEPLVRLLGIIRSHRLGSTFERRLRSQVSKQRQFLLESWDSLDLKKFEVEESARYKSLIRQHMDLRIVQSRLDKGMYSNCVQRFFRDLLLLFNNAIIFFKKNSTESVAALELRNIVTKEMTERLRKPKAQPVNLKPAAEQLASFSKSIKSSSTMVACGKRSSTKATPETARKKGDKRDGEVETKQNASKKSKESSSVAEEEKVMKKKNTKERSVTTGQRNPRSSVKNGEVKHQYGGNELSSHDALEIKMDKKETTVKKKQGAASFLKRMKQNSPGDTADNDDEDADDGSNGDISEDESKESKVSKVERKPRGKNRDRPVSERVTRSSRGRSSKEISGPTRGTGRPPKKQEMRTPESGVGAVKRGRENGDSGAGAGSSGRATKRSRR
ncbi:hypothetical protein Tsubulata_025819 [Turnera subulata]|uniref:Bromo domain-containing protein n=1 Tax=Turnera subulata TaxID=218843 RepID=A0A9Q0F905_9ROSI|nr:hypothetical protein Tsubulata_025819 [Turnera subulata]